jgi:hypothetical protein
MKTYYLLFLTVLFITACDSDPLDVDISSVAVSDLKIKRFDQAFFALDTAHLTEGIAKLEKDYGPFSTGFINNIVYKSGTDSLSRVLDLRFFLTDFSFRLVYEDGNKLLKEADFTELENGITDVFKHFKYHFPERTLPKAVYTDMTGFNYNILQIDSVYGIGLEFYLGSSSLYYEQLQWPQYRRAHCRKEYILSDFVQGWMMTEFPYQVETDNLINRMVYEGKLLYLKKALMRNSSDSLITGFSQKQLDWCVASEATIWAKLIELNVLYSENEDDFQHYTMDGPFTPGFPHQSPGKSGNWIGLRIVEAYMAKFPNTTLQQLMEIQDGQTILLKSKYKPKF